MRVEIQEYPQLKRALEELTAFLSAHEVAEAQVFDSRLVAHELIGNVLEHAGGVAQLGVEVNGGYIHIAVRTENSYRPKGKATCPSGMQERGRGLYLVEQLTVEQEYTDEGVFVRIAVKK